MFSSEAAGATIGRLRVCAPALDPLLLRLRAAAVLEAASLEPSRLPPAAILCIRSLRDPRPGTIRLDAPPPLAAQPGASDWQRAVTARLDELEAGAARPLAGSVSAGAEAVIFADRAELLACLALDWLAGQLGQRWWWQHLLRAAAGAGAALLEAWLAAAECAPEALAHLEARGAAVPLVRRLADDEVERLTGAVLERFALRRLWAGPAPADPPEASPLDTRPNGPIATAGRGRGAPRSDRPGAAIPLAPWHDLLPVAAATLSPERQLLLGLGLSLARRPAVARTSSYAARVRRWREAERGDRAPGRGGLLPDAVVAAPSLASDRLPGQPAPPTGSPGDPTGPLGSAAQPQMGAEASALEAPARPGADGSPISAAETLGPDDARSEVGLPTGEDLPALVAPDAGPGGLEVETGLGGLFFLVGLATRFGLYPDFTAPQRAGLDLPIWDFVALTGRRLLRSPGSARGTDGALRADPIWSLLARLSGRGDASAGTGFAAPEQFEAPDEWRLLFGEGACRWSRRDGRLRGWHPAGFWPLDLPLDASSAAATPDQIEALATTRLPRPRVGRLARWVDWWAAYLRARLLLALGLDGPPARAGELASVLIRHPARVLVSAARVDVLFSLDDVFSGPHSALPVRLAGIDRDPGWLPSAGRALAFHFR